MTKEIKKMLDSKDISVIMQGPIFGRPLDEPQKQFTKIGLETVRKLLPNSEIILSTWEKADTTGLSFDKVIYNQDPGSFEFMEGKQINLNRQIVSTINGLNQATRKFSLKMRSDMMLEHAGFIDYWGKYRNRCEEYKILNERVIVADIGTLNPKRAGFLFAVTDWCFFGLTEDLINIFDIPLCDEKENVNYFVDKKKPKVNKSHFLDAKNKRYSSEQYIWLECLRKYMDIPHKDMYDVNDNNFKMSEMSVCNNFLPLDLDLFGIKSQKYPKASVRGTYTAYTDVEWKRLYNKYCDGGVEIKTEVPLSKRAKRYAFKYYPIIISYINTSFPNVFNKIRRFYRRGSI